MARSPVCVETRNLSGWVSSLTCLWAFWTAPAHSSLGSSVKALKQICKAPAAEVAAWDLHFALLPHLAHLHLDIFHILFQSLQDSTSQIVLSDTPNCQTWRQSHGPLPRKAAAPSSNALQSLQTNRHTHTHTHTHTRTWKSIYLCFSLFSWLVCLRHFQKQVSIHSAAIFFNVAEMCD